MTLTNAWGAGVAVVGSVAVVACLIWPPFVEIPGWTTEGEWSCSWVSNGQRSTLRQVMEHELPDWTFVAEDWRGCGDSGGGRVVTYRVPSFPLELPEAVFQGCVREIEATYCTARGIPVRIAFDRDDLAYITVLQHR